MPSLPFPLARLWLLARGAVVDRDQPDFDQLASIDDPGKFVWDILPHAARSFAPSILLLPEDDARAAAVGYLYARMLDTYEDLSTTPAVARGTLALFAQRFDTERPGPAPVAPSPSTRDRRDETHLLLIERHRLVDEVFMGLDVPTRDRITRLVQDMAAGMIEFSTIFEHQQGVLEDEGQVLDYCHRVIGLPALFIMETLLGPVSEDHHRDALEVSELLQLANITRDVEKDLQRGVAYHPTLRSYLGSNQEGTTAAVTRARRELILLAARRAPSFRRLVDEVDLPRLSPARAAAVLMLLFTGRHYRESAVKAGMRPGSRPRPVWALVMKSLPAAFSPKWADRVMRRVETDLLAITILEQSDPGHLPGVRVWRST